MNDKIKRIDEFKNTNEFKTIQDLLDRDIGLYYHRHEGFSIKFHVLIHKSSARPISLRQLM